MERLDVNAESAYQHFRDKTVEIGRSGDDTAFRFVAGTYYTLIQCTELHATTSTVSFVVSC